MFPHREMVQSKWIFLLSENIYNFLPNSKLLTQFLAYKIIGALTRQLTSEKAQFSDMITKEKVRGGRRSQIKETMHFYALLIRVRQRSCLTDPVIPWAITAREPNPIKATAAGL